MLPIKEVVKVFKIVLRQRGTAAFAEAGEFLDRLIEEAAFVRLLFPTLSVVRVVPSLPFVCSAHCDASLAE